LCLSSGVGVQRGNTRFDGRDPRVGRLDALVRSLSGLLGLAGPIIRGLGRLAGLSRFLVRCIRRGLSGLSRLTGVLNALLSAAVNGVDAFGILLGRRAYFRNLWFEPSDLLTNVFLACASGHGQHARQDEGSENRESSI